MAAAATFSSSVFMDGGRWKGTNPNQILPHFQYCGNNFHRCLFVFASCVIMKATIWACNSHALTPAPNSPFLHGFCGLRLADCGLRATGYGSRGGAGRSALDTTWLASTRGVHLIENNATALKVKPKTDGNEKLTIIAWKAL